MTPSRLSEILTQLDWGQRPFARRLSRPLGTVQQWLSGATRIPEDVAAALEKIARFVEKNPVPRRDR